MDDFNLDDIDYSYEALSELPNDKLIELIQKQRVKIDELERISRNDQWEEIAKADEAVKDEEEIIS